MRWSVAVYSKSLIWKCLQGSRSIPFVCVQIWWLFRMMIPYGWPPKTSSLSVFGATIRSEWSQCPRYLKQYILIIAPLTVAHLMFENQIITNRHYYAHFSQLLCAQKNRAYHHSWMTQQWRSTALFLAWFVWFFSTYFTTIVEHNVYH